MDQYRVRNVRELRHKIERYREIAREILDEKAATNILALTDDLEQQARDIERGK